MPGNSKIMHFGILLDTPLSHNNNLGLCIAISDNLYYIVVFKEQEKNFETISNIHSAYACLSANRF